MKKLIQRQATHKWQSQGSHPHGVSPSAVGSPLHCPGLRVEGCRAPCWGGPLGRAGEKVCQVGWALFGFHLKLECGIFKFSLRTNSHRVPLSRPEGERVEQMYLPFVSPRAKRCSLRAMVGVLGAFV